jgi:hypothetical protein
MCVQVRVPPADLSMVRVTKLLRLGVSLRLTPSLTHPGRDQRPKNLSKLEPRRSPRAHWQGLQVVNFKLKTRPGSVQVVAIMLLVLLLSTGPSTVEATCPLGQYLSGVCTAVSAQTVTLAMHDLKLSFGSYKIMQRIRLGIQVEPILLTSTTGSQALPLQVDVLTHLQVLYVYLSSDQPKCQW